MLRIPADTLRDELAQMLDKMTQLKAVADNGVPGDDRPGAQMDQEIFQVQLRGELILLSLRLSALAEVLSDD